MMIKRKIYKTLIASLFFMAGLVVGSINASAQSFGWSGAGQSGQNSYMWGNQKKECEKKDCSNDTCELKANNAGQYDRPCVSHHTIDPRCIMNRNYENNACLDTIPLKNISHISSHLCERGALYGGKIPPRMHQGTDLSTPTGTEVLAAADGYVVWTAPMTSAGRTIAIQHNKACQCTAGNSNGGCDNVYTTIYMHLSEYLVSKGTHVKKGEVIGKVGGSNCVKKNKTDHSCLLCDPPKEATADNPCYGYGPHLHLEVRTGAFVDMKGVDGMNEAKGLGYYNKEKDGVIKGAGIKAHIIDPFCDDIQSFCGGCSYPIQGNENCMDKGKDDPWEELSPEVQAERSSIVSPAYRGGGGANEGMGSAQDTRCDYHNFLLSDDKCFFCPLFKVLFNTASSTALKSYNALKDGIVNVVIIAFAIWIAWFVLKQVSALEVKKPSKMIQEIMVQAFRVLAVVLILKVSYGHILKLTIAPVFETATSYIQTLTDARECSSNFSFLSGLDGFENEINEESTGALPISMGRNILCSMKAMQDAVWRIIAFGKECRCVGWKIKSFVFHLIPNLSYVFTGDFLIIAGLILLIAFPWCLIDCVLNMAIASALLPAAIGAWAFKITAGYLKTIWNFFLNAIFQFVFLSIILYIIITVVDQFLKVIDTYSTDYEKIISPIYGLAFWSVNGLKLVMVCLLGWVFLDNGKKIAGQFAKAPDLGIGQKTGGFFAQVGERLALGGKGEDGKRRGGALGIIKGGAELGGMAANHYIGTPARQRVGQIRNRWIMNKGTEIKDENGNTVGYELKRSLFGKRNILGQKVTRRVDLGPDGTISYSKEKENLGNQIRNWARGEANDIRVDLIQKEDLKLLDKFNGNDLQDGETLSTEADGTKTLKNSKGKVIASLKMNADGTRTLSRRNGNSVSVYDAAGNLISADRSYRNPFLFGEKQHLSINATLAPEDQVLGNIQTSFVDTNGRKLKGGDLRVNEQGQVVNQHGQVFGTLRQDGQILDKNGKIIGRLKQTVVDKDGNQVARVDASGQVIGLNGNVLNSMRVQNGQVVYTAQNPNATAKGQYQVKRSTTSIRSEILQKAGLDQRLADVAKTYAIKRERDLSSHVGKTTAVTKDHLISVRNVKNAEGEIIQQDFAFNSQIVKYLVHNNGSLNIEAIQQIELGSKMRKDLVHLAVAQEILKDRNIALSNKFAQRDTSFENGVLTLVQQNLDGSVTHLTTQIINNQMLIKSETITADGQRIEITDNGIISRVVSQKEGEKAKTHYSFNQHVKNYSSVQKLINYNNEDGKFAPTIRENEAMLGFSEEDRQRFAKQEKTGENQLQDEVFDPKAKRDTYGAYMDACYERRRAEQKIAQDLDALNKAQKEFDDLSAQMSSGGSAVLNGRLNMLQQKLDAAQSAYNNSMAELNRRQQIENSLRGHINSFSQLG